MQDAAALRNHFCSCSYLLSMPGWLTGCFARFEKISHGIKPLDACWHIDRHACRDCISPSFCEPECPWSYFILFYLCDIICDGILLFLDPNSSTRHTRLRLFPEFLWFCYNMFNQMSKFQIISWQQTRAPLYLQHQNSNFLYYCFVLGHCSEFS